MVGHTRSEWVLGDQQLVLANTALLYTYLSKYCRTKSSNCAVDEHNSFSMSVRSVLMFNAPEQSTNGTNDTNVDNS